MAMKEFPHPLDFLPRPGMREIRAQPIPLLPQNRNERKLQYGTK